MGMKNVVILTNFSSYLKSYSPIIVVTEQLRMLQRAGYEPVLLVSEGWEPPADTYISTVKTEFLPSVPVSNEAKVDATFEPDVDKLYEAMKKLIPDHSHVLTHDLIFLPDYVKHNVAARKLANENKTIRWYHLIHSATSPYGLIKEREMYGEKYVELLKDKFPNSVVLFPNSFDIPRVAKNFSYELDEVFEVPHSTDITEGMLPMTKRIYDELELAEADVIMVYPLRLDRGKNAEMNVRIMGQCQAIGLNSRLIFCDFHSTGGDKVTYREELKKLAEEQGIGDKTFFLSEFDESLNLESPRQLVLELLRISNVFCLPSKSETYSLVAQEAAASGNLLILNHDFAPMRQIYGDIAIYRQFSSNIGINGFDGEINTTYQPDTNAYMRDIAKCIKYYLENDKVLKAKTWVRRERNGDYVFRKYLEPLFYADDGTIPTVPNM